jgi:hypothetical protein
MGDEWQGIESGLYSRHEDSNGMLKGFTSCLGHLKLDEIFTERNESEWEEADKDSGCGFHPDAREQLFIKIVPKVCQVFGFGICDGYPCDQITPVVGEPPIGLEEMLEKLDRSLDKDNGHIARTWNKQDGGADQDFAWLHGRGLPVALTFNVFPNGGDDDIITALTVGHIYDFNGFNKVFHGWKHCHYVGALGGEPDVDDSYSPGLDALNPDGTKYMVVPRFSKLGTGFGFALDDRAYCDVSPTIPNNLFCRDTAGCGDLLEMAQPSMDGECGSADPLYMSFKLHELLLMPEGKVKKGKGAGSAGWIERKMALFPKQAKGIASGYVGFISNLILGWPEGALPAEAKRYKGYNDAIVNYAGANENIPNITTGGAYNDLWITMNDGDSFFNLVFQSPMGFVDDEGNWNGKVGNAVNLGISTMMPILGINSIMMGLGIANSSGSLGIHGVSEWEDWEEVDKDSFGQGASQISMLDDGAISMPLYPILVEDFQPSESLKGKRLWGNSQGDAKGAIAKLKGLHTNCFEGILKVYVWLPNKNGVGEHMIDTIEIHVILGDYLEFFDGGLKFQDWVTIPGDGYDADFYDDASSAKCMIEIKHGVEADNKSAFFDNVDGTTRTTHQIMFSIAPGKKHDLGPVYGKQGEGAWPKGLFNSGGETTFRLQERFGTDGIDNENKSILNPEPPWEPMDLGDGVEVNWDWFRVKKANCRRKRVSTFAAPFDSVSKVYPWYSATVNLELDNAGAYWDYYTFAQTNTFLGDGDALKLGSLLWNMMNLSISKEPLGKIADIGVCSLMLKDVDKPIYREVIGVDQPSHFNVEPVLASNPVGHSEGVFLGKQMIPLVEQAAKNKGFAAGIAVGAEVLHPLSIYYANIGHDDLLDLYSYAVKPYGIKLIQEQTDTHDISYFGHIVGPDDVFYSRIDDAAKAGWRGLWVDGNETTNARHYSVYPSASFPTMTIYPNLPDLNLTLPKESPPGPPGIENNQQP